MHSTEYQFMNDNLLIEQTKFIASGLQNNVAAFVSVLLYRILGEGMHVCERYYSLHALLCLPFAWHSVALQRLLHPS